MADNNYYSIADQTNVTLKGVTIDPRTEGKDPSSFDDILKISHSNNVYIEDLVVDAGGLQRENAIDMNRTCNQVSIVKARLVSGKQNAVTIKGGCNEILIQDVVIVPGAGNCDIELGNWSDQSQNYVTNVTLVNVTRSDGQPVRLRVGHSHEPHIIGGNIKRMFWGSLFVKVYWAFKNFTK